MISKTVIDTVSWCRHGGGGAIRQENSQPLTVELSTSSGNSSAFGGAINGQNASVVDLAFTTISGNTAKNKGGGIVDGPAATLRLRNNIVAGNVCTAPDDLAGDRGEDDMFGAIDDQAGSSSQGQNLLSSAGSFRR